VVLCLYSEKLRKRQTAAAKTQAVCPNLVIWETIGQRRWETSGEKKRAAFQSILYKQLTAVE